LDILDIFHEQLTQGQNGPSGEIRAFDGHELFTTLLRIDARFAMTPHVVLKSIPSF